MRIPIYRIQNYRASNPSQREEHCLRLGRQGGTQSKWQASVKAFPLVLALFACYSQFLWGETSTTARPNILFLLADDWVWPYASCLDTPVIRTPTFLEAAGLTPPPQMMARGFFQRAGHRQIRPSGPVARPHTHRYVTP